MTADGPHPLSVSLLSPVDPRRARTNAVADVRFLSSIASLGHEATWIVPAMGDARRADARSLLEPFAPAHPVSVRAVAGLEAGPRDLGRLAPIILGAPRLTRHATHAVSRDLRLVIRLVAARRRRVKVVPWLHEYRGEAWERWVCGRVDGVLATNPAILADLETGARGLPTLSVGNPVPEDRARAAASLSRADARAQIGIAPGPPLIVYTGKLYPELAELEYLLQAAAALPQARVLLTGGQPDAIRRIEAVIAERGLDNVILTGFLPSAESTRAYQSAADVLVSYYARGDHANPEHNLPNKLDEYMATGNPVVVADFPAVRELARADTAFVVRPDAPGAFIDTLRRALSDPARADDVGRRAQAEVRDRTYEVVAGRIAAFLASLP